MIGTMTDGMAQKILDALGADANLRCETEAERKEFIQDMLGLMRRDELRATLDHDTGEISFIGDGWGYEMWEECSRLTIFCCADIAAGEAAQ